MRGSVVKKGDRYYVKIELDPDPTRCRCRQKWHSGFSTKREAERARVDLLSKFDRSEYVEPSQQTLADVLTDWLKAIEPAVRPATFDSYSRNIRLHVIDRIGSVRLTKVDAGVLNGLNATLLLSGRRGSSRKGAGYSEVVVERAAKLRAEGRHDRAERVTTPGELWSVLERLECEEFRQIRGKVFHLRAHADWSRAVNDRLGDPEGPLHPGA